MHATTHTSNAVHVYQCLTAAAPWLDKKHVAFGRVAELKGLQTIFKLAEVDATQNRIVVSDCGEIERLS
jgi:cyclophilin family peptidyl-prolyl cis-trans isomerase